MVLLLIKERINYCSYIEVIHVGFRPVWFDIIVREGKRDDPVFSAILSTKLVMVERVIMDVVKYSCIQK